MLCPGGCCPHALWATEDPQEENQGQCGIHFMCVFSLKDHSLVLPVVQYTVQLPVASFILSNFTIVYGGGGNMILVTPLGI